MAYPNLWIVNVGHTADDKKSTATGYAIRLLEDLRTGHNVPVKVMQGIASVEGLALFASRTSSNS